MSSPAVTGLLRVDAGLSTETVAATNLPVPRVVSGIPLAYRLRTLLGTPLRNRVARSRQRFLKAAAADCRGIQETVLQDLLKLNSGSDFAKDFKLQIGRAHV